MHYSIQKSKRYLGREAAAIIARLISRPDLDNAVLRGTYYEFEDGIILSALVVETYRPEMGLPVDAFPIFCAFFLFDSEQDFWNRVEWSRQAMIAEGFVPPPIRNWHDDGRPLSGAAAKAFLATHTDLGIGIYGFGRDTDHMHYFQDAEGRVTSAQVWLDGPPERIEAFKETTGPWVYTHLRYDSEAHAREWQAHILDSKDEVRNHLLYPYTTNKPAWNKELPDWIAFLARELQLPPEALDVSLGSCDLLDRQRKKLRISGKRFMKDFFAPCLGYLYEVVRRYWNGTWELRPAPGAPVVFEPFIRTPDGQVLEFFVDYWDLAYEDYKHLLLYGLAQGMTETLAEERRRAGLG